MAAYSIISIQPPSESWMESSRRMMLTCFSLVSTLISSCTCKPRLPQALASPAKGHGSYQSSSGHHLAGLCVSAWAYRQPLCSALIALESDTLVLGGCPYMQSGFMQVACVRTC